MICEAPPPPPLAPTSFTFLLGALSLLLIWIHEYMHHKALFFLLFFSSMKYFFAGPCFRQVLFFSSQLFSCIHCFPCYTQFTANLSSVTTACSGFFLLLYLLSTLTSFKNKLLGRAGTNPLLNSPDTTPTDHNPVQQPRFASLQVCH